MRAAAMRPRECELASARVLKIPELRGRCVTPREFDYTVDCLFAMGMWPLEMIFIAANKESKHVSIVSAKMDDRCVCTGVCRDNAAAIRGSVRRVAMFAQFGFE